MDITVTERAARRIGELAQGEADPVMLRISVEGGGCSGFQYKFDLTTDRAADDVVLEAKDRELEVNLTRADLDGAEHLGEGVYRLANGQQVRFLSTATVH